MNEQQQKLMKTAAMYTALGQKSKPALAKKYYRGALSIRERLAAELGLPPLQVELINEYCRLGLVCEQLREKDEARAQYRAALARLEGLAGWEQNVGLLRGRWEICRRMGRTYLEQQMPASAAPWGDKALACAETLLRLTGAPQDTRRLTTACRILGRIYGELGQRDKEIHYRQRALALWKTLRQPPKEGPHGKTDLQDKK